MEQCHHYWSDTGKRCTAEASIKAYIKGSSTNPEPWKVLVCAVHAEHYIKLQYQVQELTHG